MSSVNIGLIGFGTIGSGVYHLLKENAEIVKNKTGISLKIKTICEIRQDDVKKKVSGVRLTTDWKDIIGDDSIDVVIELIGGIEPAKSIITAALKRGKNVVTANKKLLAEEGEEILQMAADGTGRLGFEAAVGGGIPCIQALRTGLVGYRIN